MLKPLHNMIQRVKLTKFIVQAYPVLFIVMLSLHGCTTASPSPEEFPERDIVFQTATLWGGKSDSKLGFINADGSGLTYLQISYKSSSSQSIPAVGSPVFPIITGDNSTLVFRTVGMSGHPGNLALMRNGQPAIICPVGMGVSRPSLNADQTHIVTDLVSPGGRLYWYDLNECQSTNEAGEGKIFEIDINRYPTFGALSPTNKYLVFQAVSDEISTAEPPLPAMYVRDLDTDKETFIGFGLAPAWSPDGQWIAFRGTDGIYLVRPNGEERQLLVEYISPEEGRSYEEWPPLPTWSSDGEWLVYHKCILEPGRRVDCSDPLNGINFSIFKVNVNTGYETKVFDGGLNPYWRQVVSSP